MYYVELTQEDPPDSPTPGSGHYAGELTDFDTPVQALAAGIARLGQPPAEDEFSPCCDWQSRDTIVSAVVVYFEDENGNRAEDNPIQAHLRKKED